MMTQPIVTDRLYLRRFAVSDAEACYCNWMSDPEVTHFLTWGVHPDVEHTRKVLMEWVGEYSRGSLDWCITLRGEYVPIGSVTAVRQHPESGYCELGYCLAQDYWDKGYMTEAIRAVTGYIFTNTPYRRIQARHEIENEASGRCLEKSGFHEIGRFVRDNPKTGRPCIYRMMSVDRPSRF